MYILVKSGVIGETTVSAVVIEVVILVRVLLLFLVVILGDKIS